MKDKLKTANILSILLTCIFGLVFFSSVFKTSYADTANPSEPGTETEIPGGGDGGSGVVVTPDTDFDAPPKFVSALQAWTYAETKLYSLSHWESLTRNHEIRPNINMAGQTIRVRKYYSGQQNSYGTWSNLMLPGKVIGKESFTYMENKGGIITKRETDHQTSDREPIWKNERVYTWTEAEYIKINGSLPFMPGYEISKSTTMNGSSRPINDGQKITFSLALKTTALANYVAQVQEASNASTPPLFQEGGLVLEVVLNAKTGMFISIRTVEEYNITVMGFNVDVRATRTEEFFNFVK